MIIINLLPKSYRQKIDKEIFTILFQNLVSLILIFIIFISIVLLASKVVLQNNFNKVVAQTTYLARETTPAVQEIKKINRRLTVVNKIQKQYFKWSNFLINFSSLVPQNIDLTSLTASQKPGGGEIKIKGIAAKRENLLEFKERLEASQLFTEIKLPLSSLIAKENIDFVIDAKLLIKNE